MILLVAAVGSLAGGLYAALAYFWGTMSQEAYRTALLAATISWFVFATLWAGRKTKG